MLDPLAEKAKFHEWLAVHVDPRIKAVAEASAKAPMNDVEYAAVLDKAISPFVYWLREQPSSVTPSTAQPVPRHPTSSASPILQGPAGSLSQNVPQAFMDGWGLYKTTHDEALGFERLYLDRYIADFKDFKKLDDQLKSWGFVSVQRVDDRGKTLRLWERRIP